MFPGFKRIVKIKHFKVDSFPLIGGKVVPSGQSHMRSEGKAMNSKKFISLFVDLNVKINVFKF